MIKNAKVIPVNDYMAQKLKMDELQEQIDFLKLSIKKLTPLHSISTHCALVVNTQELTKIVNPSCIIMIQSSSNYSTIYLTDGSNILTSKTLKYWASKVEANHNFLRIHNSFLINQKHVLSFDKKLGQVNLVCDRNALCSRRMKTYLLNKLQEA